MTSVGLSTAKHVVASAIDLENVTPESVALIDLENIRLSWQKEYGKVFEYDDLVLLCDLAERLVRAPISRVVVFASDPEEYRNQQIKYEATRHKLLQSNILRPLSEHEATILGRELKARGVSLRPDVDAGVRMVSRLQEDELGDTFVSSAVPPPKRHRRVEPQASTAPATSVIPTETGAAPTILAPPPPPMTPSPAFNLLAPTAPEILGLGPRIIHVSPRNLTSLTPNPPIGIQQLSPFPVPIAPPTGPATVDTEVLQVLSELSSSSSDEEDEESMSELSSPGASPPTSPEGSVPPEDPASDRELGFGFNKRPLHSPKKKTAPEETEGSSGELSDGPESPAVTSSSLESHNSSASSVSSSNSSSSSSSSSSSDVECISSGTEQGEASDIESDECQVIRDVKITPKRSRHKKGKQKAGAGDDEEDDILVVKIARTMATTPTAVKAKLGDKRKNGTMKHPMEPIEVDDAGAPMVRRLTGVNCTRKVELRLYGFKNQKGRMVQRGCDVALGAEITKACFHPYIEHIVLFSADSDFYELMEQNLMAENVGGVYKFCKTSWICGFEKSFKRSDLKFQVIRDYSRRLLNREDPTSMNTTGHQGVYRKGRLNYVVIDQVWPQIKKQLECSAVERIPWQPH